MESSDVAEIKRHFSVVAEGLEKKIQLVAEGVSLLDEKVDRRSRALEERMERGFDEVNGHDQVLICRARQASDITRNRPR